MSDTNIQQTSAWLTHVNNAFKQTSGTFLFKDKLGKELAFEWEKVDPQSARLNEIIQGVSAMLAETYVAAELQFAQQHPDTISSEMFLKPLEPLFKDGIDKVNWANAEQILRENLHMFFKTTDFAKYSSPHDVQLFVIAKDVQADSKIGVIQFLITPQFKYGSVKIGFFAVAENYQQHELGHLLMSTIFKLVNDVTTIFLHARITNTPMIAECQKLGFSKVSGPLPYWTDMEYVTGTSHIIQTTAESLK